ncbi:MAG: Ig-like domain-containing protein [Marinilabiliaceae bacterium]
MRMRHAIGILSAVASAMTAAAVSTSCDKSDVMLNHIYITAETEKVAPGDSVQMSLHAYPERANTGYPDAPIIWSSSDTTVATVDQSGMVRALKYGQTTIKVNYGKLDATKLLTVSDKAGFTDTRLEQFLIDRFDTNGDGVLEGYETASYTGIDLTDLRKYAGDDTVDLTGLINFVNIQTMRIERVNMKGLNFGNFPYLREVHIDACGVGEIDLRSAKDLTDVRIMACPNLKAVLLGSYEEYGTNNIRTFQCSRCDISELDLTRCGATLWDIDVAGNKSLTQLDLTVDTMLHSAVYTCETTDITWPTGVEVDEIIKECQ